MAAGQGYGQFCPVSMGAEIFAARWTPLVLRELMMGSTRFGELQKGVPRMSRSLLAQRLRELEDAGLIESRPQANGRGAEYHLTDAGKALYPVVFALGKWAHRWLQKDIPERNLDPALLLWDIRRNVDVAALPAQPRTQVQFELLGVPAPQRLSWLLVEAAETELCYKWPGFANDLEVQAHVADLTNVWLGHVRLPKAIADGRIRLAGSRAQRDAFRKWFTLSTFGRGKPGNENGAPDAPARRGDGWVSG